MNQNRILHEDNDIIVCHKPAGIATQTARVGQADMVSEIANYLVHGKKASDGRRRQDIAGKGSDNGGGKSPYVGVVHRLDQPVEGILVFAKNKGAAAELSRQAAGEEMKKEYLALVCGRDMQQSGELTDYLLKDGKTNTSRVVPPEVKGAKEARLFYEVLRYESPEDLFLVKKDDGGISGKERAEEHISGRNGLWCAVVRICLHTGRHHQIRVQMANAGMPLLGDRKYAGQEVIALSEKLGVRETALCAYRLSFKHPQTGERMQFETQPEGMAFQKTGLRLTILTRK
ncbi:MAG: RluA family pseudouridine synthase [Lachnospiraceae bacterium]|nr:RluA family pseudouridine synthase [Lachnospiraceae bacterium]